MAHHAGLVAVFQLILHTRVGDRVRLRHGPVHGLKLLLRLLHMIAERIILHDAGISRRGFVLEAVAHARIPVGKLPQRFVGAAEQRILVHQRMQTVGRRRVASLVVIKHAGLVFARRQHFLDVAQLLLSIGSELAVGELHQQLPAFIFGANGLLAVAVGLLHLLVMDVADLLLGLGSFFHGRIEEDKVLVFGFGLRPGVRAAFAVPAIRDRELGFRQKLAGVVGVDERIQRQARDFVAAALNIVDGLVKQDLIGLLRVLGDGVLVFVTPAAAYGDETRSHRQNDDGMNPISSKQHKIIFLDPNFCGILRGLPHLGNRGAGIGGVKYRRPCNHPVTPRADHLRQVLERDAAVDFDG